VQWITIVDEPTPVRSENGVIYSTQPLVAVTSDERRFVLKGPSTEVVAAEAIGYRLAGLAGLATPGFALCRHPRSQEVYFASEMMTIRSIEASLSVPDLVVNPELIVDCFPFDVWVANVDRNIGSFVGEIVSETPLRVRAFSIDFERCNILRGISPIMVNALKPTKLKSGDAAVQRLIQGKRFPLAACGRISAIPAASIELAFSEIGQLLPTAPWRPGTDLFLHQRAQMLGALAGEVWNA
jgi:hypothetical protein